MLVHWETDIATGNNVLVPCDSDAVIRLGKSYAQLYTAQKGFREMDILHVATAKILCAKKFLTFDKRQRDLAQFAGLETPL